MTNPNPDISKLEKKLKISFPNKKHITYAFIHSSYLNENKGKGLSSNERLEFLGDTVVSLVISSHLYSTFPDLAEGELTTIRSAVVNTKSLARAAERLDLGSYLMLSRGEEDSGGRINKTLLANTFEALTGAIYLEKGIDKAKEFLETFLVPFINQVLNEESYKDYKSKLQEIVQEKLKMSPNYELISATGPDHAKEFEIAVTINGKELGRGAGHSKQEAEQNAAQRALENWPGI